MQPKATQSSRAGALNRNCNKNFWTLEQRREVAAVAEWYRYRTVACFVTGSSPVPLKTRRVGQRCTLNLSRVETSSRWCGVVVRRGGASSGVAGALNSKLVRRQKAEQCDVNIQSIKQRREKQRKRTREVREQALPSENDRQSYL
ncbi:uncharacterized protein TNCV_766481 [Trichonephila clavipes]|nr:uncharacterized protein TNCV_766481 [Trichonephila clavipes]